MIEKNYYSAFFNFGSTLIPENDKVRKGKEPEDEIYTSSEVLVVADGVGGWSL